MIYEYSIQRCEPVSEQDQIISGMANNRWRLISAVYNSVGMFYLLYFERIKQ